MAHQKKKKKKKVCARARNQCVCAGEGSARAPSLTIITDITLIDHTGRTRLRVWPHNVIVTGGEPPPPPKPGGVFGTREPPSFFFLLCDTAFNTWWASIHGPAPLLDAMPKELQLAGSGLHLGQLHVCVRVCDEGN